MAQTCTSFERFAVGAAVDWYVVNDGVMGGRSLGGFELQEDGLTFEGSINTNGGGFSSIRREVPRGALEGVTSMKLRGIGDGRAYKLTFRTSARRFGRPISYQATVPPIDGEGVVEVPLAGMRTTIFGREVQAPAFDPSVVREMGIILADGKDGPFRLVIQEIEACR